MEKLITLPFCVVVFFFFCMCVGFFLVGWLVVDLFLFKAYCAIISSKYYLFCFKWGKKKNIL